MSVNCISDILLIIKDSVIFRAFQFREEIHSHLFMEEFIIVLTQNGIIFKIPFVLKMREDENQKKKRKLETTEKPPYKIDEIDETFKIHQFTKEKILFMKKIHQNLIFITNPNLVHIFNLESKKLTQNFIALSNESRITCCSIINNLNDFIFENIYGKEGFVWFVLIMKISLLLKRKFVFLGFENGDVYSFSLNQNFKCDELNQIINIRDSVKVISKLKENLIILGENGVFFHLSKENVGSDKWIPLQQEYKIQKRIKNSIEINGVLIFLDVENSIFLVETIKNSTIHLNFRKIPFSNDVCLIQENEDSVNSFWVLNQQGHLIDFSIPSIDDIDKNSNDLLSLDLIQNKIKNSLVQIDENTKNYENKKKEIEKLNIEISSMNSITKLFAQKKFNFLNCETNPKVENEQNKITIKIENQSNLTISNWKIIVIIEGIPKHVISVPLKSLKSQETSLSSFNVGVQFENHQKKFIQIFALYKLPNEIISLKLKEETITYFDFMKLTNEENSFISPKLSINDHFFDCFKKNFVNKDQTIQTFKIPSINEKELYNGVYKSILGESIQLRSINSSCSLQGYDYQTLLTVRSSLISKVKNLEFSGKDEKMIQFFKHQEDKLNEIQHLLLEIFNFEKKMNNKEGRFDIHFPTFFNKIKKSEDELKSIHFENRKFLGSNLK
eukprot:gene10952-3660_t